MKQRNYIESISQSWSFDGFLGNLREGIFNLDLYNKLYSALKEIQIEDDEPIEPNLIQVLWFIPIFMYRQKEYFPDIPANEYDILRENIEEELARIFKYP